MKDVIRYTVGNEQNPGDPFGRSSLVIQISGSARLDQFTRGGNAAWSGTVTASALDQFWRALEEAAFPDFPSHPVPGGSAIRDLNVGGRGGKSAYIAYHAAVAMPGYNTAFAILDTVIRQISEGTVKVGPDGANQIVEAVHRVFPPQ